jgi:hypothetical protein
MKVGLFLIKYQAVKASGGMDTKIHAFSKPSQAKVLTGGGDLRFAQVDVPRLLAIPAFGRVAGLFNRHLNSNRGICLTLTILKSG